MESYGATCVYVTDSGGALDMDGYVARLQAYDRALRPETERGIHAHCEGVPWISAAFGHLIAVPLGLWHLRLLCHRPR